MQWFDLELRARKIWEWRKVGASILLWKLSNALALEVFSIQEKDAGESYTEDKLTRDGKG
jgi:hypothetical protein